jgi:hypothetical protein
MSMKRENWMVSASAIAILVVWIGLYALTHLWLSLRWAGALSGLLMLGLAWVVLRVEKWWLG